MRKQISLVRLSLFYLVVLTLLAGCGIPERLSNGISTTPSPQVVATRFTAELIGQLVEKDGCLRVEAAPYAKDYALVWPAEYKIQRDAAGITMVDGQGKQTTWQVGQWVHLGGGESGSDEKCPGPYWLVGDVEASSISPPLALVFKEFPLLPGASWTFVRESYQQSPSDPNQLLHEKEQTIETVVEVKDLSTFSLVHVKGRRSVLLADPGWVESQPPQPEVYEFWYVLQDGRVYRSETQPDPTALQVSNMTEEYEFPLTIGTSWCPSKAEAGSATNCEFIGKRQVEREAGYQTQAGKFDQCYQLVDYFNGGNVIRWFCTGVGPVATNYDHAGTRFGYADELVSFSSGSPSP